MKKTRKRRKGGEKQRSRGGRENREMGEDTIPLACRKKRKLQYCTIHMANIHPGATAPPAPPAPQCQSLWPSQTLSPARGTTQAPLLPGTTPKPSTQQHLQPCSRHPPLSKQADYRTATYHDRVENSSPLCLSICPPQHTPSPPHSLTHSSQPPLP